MLIGSYKTWTVLAAAGALGILAPVSLAQHHHESPSHSSPPPAQRAEHPAERPSPEHRGEAPGRPARGPDAFSQGRPAPRQVPRPPSLPQPGHAGSWLSQHRDLPPAQQQKALESSPDFRRLPPERQEQLKQRLQGFDRLPTQQQERVIQRMHVMQHLTPEQRQTVRDFQHQMQNLPPGRRQMVRTALRDLRQMPPDQRQQVLDSPRFRNLFTAQEQKMLNDALQLPLAPASSEALREQDEPN